MEGSAMDLDPFSDSESEPLLFLLSSIFDCYDDRRSLSHDDPNEEIQKYSSLKGDDEDKLDLSNQSPLDEACSLLDLSSSSKLEETTSSVNSLSCSILEEATKSVVSRNPSKSQSKQEGNYPKRIRKSKYSDICGDLSHIRRDPKFVKRYGDQKQIGKQSKRELKRMASNSDIEVSQIQKNNLLKKESPDKEREDNLLVQELMKFISNPRTAEHQHCALAVLSSDENLMRLFLEEKAKLNNETFPLNSI